MVDMQYVPAANTSKGSNLPIDRIVVHGAVSRTFAGGALQVARYFAGPNAGGSAHVIVDPATAVRSVPDNVIAWHAPPNPRSLGLEFCDLVLWNQDRGRTAAYYDPRLATPALFAARWQRPEWQSMLRLGAEVVRDWAKTYSVPLSRIVAPLTGLRGVCGHLDVSLTWRQTNHTDPGPDFPWAQFMQLIQSPTPAPTPVEEDMPPTLPRIIIARGPDDKTGADDALVLELPEGRFVHLSPDDVPYAARYVAHVRNPDDGALYQSEIDRIEALYDRGRSAPRQVASFRALPDDVRAQVAAVLPAGVGVDPPRHDAGQDMSGGDNTAGK